MKILILMAYYNRPEMVKLSIQSILNQSHLDWELAFVDDGSEIPGEPIVREILFEHLDKVKFYNTNHSVEQKLVQGGSMFGSMWNDAMYNTNADIGIMLCDDDALAPEYLAGLNDYYSNHNEVNYSYGHISPFSPKNYKDIKDVPLTLAFHLNHTVPIDPYCKVDASQVSWRIKPVIEHSIKFIYPKTTDLDANFYRLLYNSFSDCIFNNLVAQHKGWHSDQMGKRSEDLYSVKDK